MSELDPAAAARIAASPLPNKKTLRHRRNPFIQFGHFVALNLKMIRVIGSSHQK